jgi:transcriptional regulator GlxA family with amidase domain
MADAENTFDQPAPAQRLTARHVVFIGYEGLQPLDLVGPMEVFSKANQYAPTTGHAPFRYELTVASPEGGEIGSASGLVIGRTVPLRDLPDQLDSVIVAGGTGDGLRLNLAGPLINWLKVHSSKVRRLASVCTGAFVLGAAGLLDGRRAATHWSSCEELQRMFPEALVEPDSLFVSDGNIYTSAGITAGIDLSLALVEQDLGPQVALAVARDLVLFLRRPGGQTQFSASLAAQARTGGRLDELLVWMADNPDADLSLPALADRAAMSERNFGRVFVRQAGMTPACYVECIRLDRAKLYLETTDWPLARVAERSGLGSVATLIRAFAKRLGITPDAYRKRFGIGASTMA